MITLGNEYLKRWLYGRIGVCYNSLGVPFSLAKHLQKWSRISVIDVGAHAGEFTNALDRFCGVERGLLLEAQPGRAAELSKLFSPERFEIRQCVVCDRSGEIDLEINEFDATTSMLKIRREMAELAGLDVRPKATIRCKTARLDDLVSSVRFPRIELLKLDVQGAEHLVIEGAPKTLLRTQMIWTEVSFVQLYEQSCLFHEVHARLREKGFALAELEGGFRSPTNELLQADALFTRP